MIQPNFLFQKQFGRIFRLIPDAQLAFETLDGKLYSIPKNLSEAQIETLMRTSVAQKKNLLFPLVKKHEIILEPNVDY